MSEVVLPLIERRPPRPPGRYVLPGLGVGALVVGVVLLFVLRGLVPHKPLPMLGQLPQFALLDQAGAPFGSEDLRGKVWVADFIFTHCTQTCPALTARMRELAAKVDPGAVHLVSFSVDPENDTPAVLGAYAARVPADAKLWSFLTGPADAVREAVVAGFKVDFERVQKKGAVGEYDVLHGNWFVLGDRTGVIRGYYEMKTEADVDALAADVKRLAGAR